MYNLFNVIPGQLTAQRMSSGVIGGIAAGIVVMVLFVTIIVAILVCRRCVYYCHLCHSQYIIY